MLKSNKLSFTHMRPFSTRLVFWLFLSLVLSACGLIPRQEAASVTEPSVDPRLALYDEQCTRDSEYWEKTPPESLTLWDRVRHDFQIVEENSPYLQQRRVQQQLNWYKKHPSYIARVSKRAEPYLYHIVNRLEEEGVPAEIALIPIFESAYDVFAYSRVRASGLWQFMPRTGASFGLKQNWWFDGRRDIVGSTDAAITYFKQLNRAYKGDWLLALAAYNSGSGNVNKAIRKNKKRGRPTDFWNLDLPKETKAYVPKLIALATILREPAQYNAALYPIKDEPYFKVVDTGGQIDLAQAAALADIDMTMLYKLNPGFNRWATDPKGPHRLLLPIEKADLFAARIKAIPADERITWQRYTIKSGDTLSTIARGFKVNTDLLKEVNQLRSNNIRAGKTLIVPVASQDSSHYSLTVKQRLEKARTRSARYERGKRIDYTVQAGDSLWSISRVYKVRTHKIAQWNNMSPKDPIKPGQVLAIWTDYPEALTQRSGVIRKVNYRVRNGDSLHRIADKFNIRVADIKRWNKIASKKYLQPGDTLKLFVDVTKAQ